MDTKDRSATFPLTQPTTKDALTKMTGKSWISLARRSSQEEEVAADFGRVCPDRSKSSSRPRPPPKACFPKLILEDPPNEKQAETPQKVADDEDNTSLTEVSLEEDLEEEQGMSPSYLPKQQQKGTPPSSMDALKAARRRNNLGASIRSFFDSFRDGEIEEIDFEFGVCEKSPSTNLDAVFVLL